MESLIIDVNWTAVVVGGVVAWIVGGLWYSDKMFAPKWRAGIGTPAIPNMPMWPGMFTQAIGTFLLSWVIGIATMTHSLSFSILIALTISALVKANGFFAGKTTYAIAVETTYILVMVAIMVTAQIMI